MVETSSSTIAYSGKDQNPTSDAASDVSTTQITSHKFNGHNYLQWSQTFKLYITGRGKAEYILGKQKIPDITDLTYDLWLRENNMIMSWLINSMTPDVGVDFLLYYTTKEIWEAAKETYSSSDNVAELFEIGNKINSLCQEEMSVTQYYNTIIRYWQQLDLFETHNWSSTTDVALYKQITTQRRVFQFLYGLNSDLDAVKGRIIATKPLPSLREAFSEVRREESRRVVMLPPNTQPEGAALVTHSTNKPRREKPWCDHCRKVGHVKENCWKLHGKPANWKPQRLKQKPDGSAHMASTDIAGQNLRASDYMTGDQSLFHTYQSLHASSQIKTADGSLSAVLGTGYGLGEGDWQC
ncbi:hypothetical protein HRI_000675400 [Hibiscus trionum]|uniref:Retrotransposon Copia-like N-terminal domain-containing protein n=1 Tax=Hibiscus trionum TaxID=183268 RepID=A0A9W7H4W6_HIBTR|nr:hypothetical protein HRI_000675400 [Hibiscus trionum]